MAEAGLLVRQDAELRANLDARRAPARSEGHDQGRSRSMRTQSAHRCFIMGIGDCGLTFIGLKINLHAVRLQWSIL